MSLEEKVEFVALMSPLLFMIEFAVLIEFTEVIVPIMYAVFLAAISQLPNRNYYPQFGKLSPEHMITTVQNVLTYATLEFISFILIIALITKKLHFSPLHQLALVLDKQWLLVQSKIILWTVFTIQYSLLHFGADFTMKFAWLHPPPSDRPTK
ncbi:hypothetical protein Poli38472_010014 [Pythium oligandrum]|uniref:Uncharacterized protein n=1 Tax=Pythium oligandrum TaxID=41045 RepID=A0A8K1FCL9_PYTOL|nr:hypothetical protein Poli38472_010014 [Pythium oligandrum]|eukprot:TMW58455.1 hypothetical protein Poli38472_010014 [Pythium oligandrum]